jgi:hypothetical protein
LGADFVAGDPSKRLTVIDYIGNHRSFMLKPQALFNLPPGDRELLNLLERLDAGTAELPPGCEVTYDLEVVDIFRSLLSRSDSAVDLLKRRYQDFRETLGVRPTAAEMFREGYNPRAMHTSFGSWLGFVKAQGGLSAEETRHTTRCKGSCRPSKRRRCRGATRCLCFLPCLTAINFLVRFPSRPWPRRLARSHLAIRESQRILLRSANDSSKLRKMLMINPIEAWVGGRGTSGVSYFSFEGDVFKTQLTLSDDAAPRRRNLCANYWTGGWRNTFRGQVERPPRLL